MDVVALDSKRIRSMKTSKNVFPFQRIDFSEMTNVRTDSMERHSVTVTSTLVEDLTAAD